VLTFDDGYLGVWRHAFPVLRDLSAPFTLYLTTLPIETGAPLHSGADQPLTWQVVCTMMESGLVTLGAHTHSHPDLRHASESEVREELEISDALIEARTGQRPEHFAYPWGYWSQSAHTSVRDRYETAALGSGPADMRGLDQGRFHRVPVLGTDTAWAFQRRMFGGFRLEDRLRRGLKNYRGP
jgi:peptidoglycan/xylan/chitin deacetylase (PgdA/CDA1 family)